MPPERLERWFSNFRARHGDFHTGLSDGCLVARAVDGEQATVALPLGRRYVGAPDPAAFAAAAAEPAHWGVLLVRKGGFAVAALHGDTVLGSKVGQRHVQGRTKAGGQSQQRFARRRDNQARQAYEATADHAHRVLVGEAPTLSGLVCGGDRQAVTAVLADPRLEHLEAVRCEPWLPVPDPRRAVLDGAIADARSVGITIISTGSGGIAGT